MPYDFYYYNVRKKIMEIDVKNRNQRNRRRERAQRMQAERERDVVDGGDSAEDDQLLSNREKPPRPPLRRKKQKEPSPLLEEDIIDGFAILAFKTYEDLEVLIDLQFFFVLFIDSFIHQI